MAKISSTLDIGLLQRGDAALGQLGIQPFLIPTLNKIDIDPDQLIHVRDAYQNSAESIRSAGPAMAEKVGGEDCWEGESRDKAEEYTECVAKWWQQILDFILGVIDWIVQLVDWILDALRQLCQLLVWLAAWVAAIVTSIAMILIATGVGAVALPVLKVIFTTAGAVGVLAFILGIILKLLDYLIEWLQDLIRAGRDALCGGGIIPRTDPGDWDPDPLPLPSWPF